MPTPVINYAGQPWTAGATWQTNNAGNFGTQEATDFLNGSNATLYTGDVVVLGQSGTIPDPTGFNVTSTVTASSPYVVGVVGGMTNQAFAGGPIPLQTGNWRYDTFTLAASVTQPDTATVATDVGKEVIGPGIPSGAYIVSNIPGTSFTMNVAGTLTTSQTVAIGPREGAVGPGWPGFPVGEVVPVVMQGWGYVNIGTNTVAAGAMLSTSATARVAVAVTVTTYVATSPGTFIATALEAQSAGIPAGDGTTNKLIRCWICKV